MPKRKYSNFGEPVKCEFEDCTVYFQKTTKTKMQRFCSDQCSQAWRKVSGYKQRSKHPELRFEPNNCQTLCMACHYLKTYEREIPEGVIWGSYKQNKQKEIG